MTEQELGRMDALLNRVQEQLDNNWAVNADDIQTLLDEYIICNTLQYTNRKVADARKEALNNILNISNRKLYQQSDSE